MLSMAQIPLHNGSTVSIFRIIGFGKYILNFRSEILTPSYVSAILISYTWAIKSKTLLVIQQPDVVQTW